MKPRRDYLLWLLIAAAAVYAAGANNYHIC
jgi:hypothetical protein